MKNSKFLVLALLTAVVFSACSKTVENEPVANEPVKVVATYPEGCAAESTLTVKSAEAGEVTYAVDNSWYLDWKDSGTFYFVSWDDFDPKNYSAHEIVGKDVKASWDLKTVDKSAPKAGTWNYRAEGENNELTWLNISTEKLAGGVFDDKGKVEITYFGDDYVCGTVTAADSSSSMKGDFIAKYYKWEF